MLYLSLIDVLFLLVGILIGIILMSCICRSGYIHKCDNCIYTELLEMMEGENE